jgi:hypothetical protein
MLLWFAGLAFVLVWSVFRDTAIDYRLVMLGAVVPDLLDAPFGGARVFHTLVAAVTSLVVVMLVTRGRRHLRRQLLALPIGVFCHLVLDGMWTRTGTFWWPIIGGGFEGTGIPSFDRPWLLLAIQELAGLLALVWLHGRFRLGEPERRELFVRTGRLGRDLRDVEPRP